MTREFLQSLMEMPEQVLEAILTRQQEKEDAWQAQLRQVQFEGILRQAVAGARGRNYTAIAALLDTQSLSQAEDLQQEVEDAVAQLKKSCGYLFESAAVPGYAPGTGAGGDAEPEQPQTLAGALREKFGR